MWTKPKEKSKKKAYFTEEWMSEWQKAINSSENYRKKGKGWNAPLILKFTPLPEIFKQENSIGIFLDLNYGECKELRYATEEDLQKSDVVLTSDERTWVMLMEKSQDPTKLIMKNRLKLEKGSLILLSTQKKAAEALLKTTPSNSGVPEGSMVLEEEKITPKSHKKLATVSRGLNFSGTPMKLFRESKINGEWNPAEIDFSQDAKDRESLNDEKKLFLSHITALLAGGKEALTLNVPTIIQAVAKEERIEEEICLASLLFDEAKHTEFLSLFSNNVLDGSNGLERFHGPLYKSLIYEKLPQIFGRLETDISPLVQLKAAAIYFFIIKGTLIETWLEASLLVTEKNNIMPAYRSYIKSIQKDEKRHSEFGIYMIERILNENKKLRAPIEKEVEELLYDATNVIQEVFTSYEEKMPFGMEKEILLDHAIKQYQKKVGILG